MFCVCVSIFIMGTASQYGRGRGHIKGRATSTTYPLTRINHSGRKPLMPATSPGVAVYPSDCCAAVATRAQRPNAARRPAATTHLGRRGPEVTGASPAGRGARGGAVPARGDSRGRSRWWRLPARSRRTAPWSRRYRCRRRRWRCCCCWHSPCSAPPVGAGTGRGGTGGQVAGREPAGNGGEGQGRAGNGGEGKRGEKRGKEGKGRAWAERGGGGRGPRGGAGAGVPASPPWLRGGGRGSEPCGGRRRALFAASRRGAAALRLPPPPRRVKATCGLRFFFFFFVPSPLIVLILLIYLFIF